jgi:BON domain
MASESQNHLRLFPLCPDYRGVLRALAIFCIATAVLFGQTKTTTAPAKKAPTPAGTSAQEDKQIEATIRAKLAKSKIGKDGFTVRVQGGIAYWEGKTDVVQHKGSATRMAKIAGAKAVVNNIKISEAGKEKASENLDEGRRRAQVKRSEPRTDK